MRKSNRIASLFVAAVLLAPGVAHATCLQSDLAGTWQAYTFSDAGNWTRCKLTINDTGKIANTTCTAVAGNGALTQGSVTVTAPAKCTFTAQFKIDDERHRVLHGTFSPSLEIGHGVGTFPGGGQFVVNMVRVLN